jgi:hypothetical protein
MWFLLGYDGFDLVKSFCCLFSAFSSVAWFWWGGIELIGGSVRYGEVAWGNKVLISSDLWCLGLVVCWSISSKSSKAWNWFDFSELIWVKEIAGDWWETFGEFVELKLSESVC